MSGQSTNQINWDRLCSRKYRCQALVVPFWQKRKAKHLRHQCPCKNSAKFLCLGLDLDPCPERLYCGIHVHSLGLSDEAIELPRRVKKRKPRTEPIILS